ncbi:zinc-binding alcohol dehydrogenase [Enemella dayhoffiae]|uniref:Zinc-binding alcohol dehydrogenase n=1 Tax=Enemella dayhoffiae TaxID=2016507 RepID=A0A255GT84_9ACTN|nr:zinc-binding alcohol dehydrogenase [Enemella dayhoffiae]OYO18682.1 zinc-binding alcohol dehydrogenase [Enemella dayhoffiae]
MKRRNLIVCAPGRIEIVTEELPELPDGGLLLETIATGFSAGTELTYVKGVNPALHRVLDTELGLFVENPGGATDVAYPVTRMGYMEVARVAKSRTAAFAEGAVVAIPYGHATHHVADPVREHIVPVPDDLDPLLGVYVAHMGPICANGLLHAAAEVSGAATDSLGAGVRGRLVVITGAGLIGLLVALMAQHHGAREVVVVDADPQRRAYAEQLGFTALDLDDDPGLVLKTRWRHGAGDHGADVVFQCRGQAAAMHQALRCLRPQGTLVDLAFYTAGAQELRLGEEFHHNGLRIVTAQIGRVPRGLAHVWDRQRLSAETIEVLRVCGDRITEHLGTDVIPLDEAPELMRQLAARERHVLSAIFTC